MSQTIELNQGEVKVNFSSPTSGKVTFEELGLTDADLVFEGGLLRMVSILKELVNTIITKYQPLK